MRYCIIPGCENPQNEDLAKYCLSCGSKLLLRERYRPIKPIGRGGFGRTFLAVDEDIPSKPRCVIKQFYFLEKNTEYVNKAISLFNEEAVLMVSSRLGNILDKLLQNTVSQRYQSSAEVLKAIAKAALTTPTRVLASPQLAEIQTKTSTLPVSSPSDSVLRTQAGIDYTKLQQMLEAQQWQKADRETWNIMCLLLGKPAETPLESRDIDRLPCVDLSTIDYLWVNASRGRFGFSVQKQIYESLKGDYISFCQRVNWPSYNSTTFYKSLKFSEKAPAGHLPSRIWAGGAVWQNHAGAMAAKLSKCGIHNMG